MIEMNLLEEVAANRLEKTGQNKKITISGWTSNSWDVYRIPLKFLYYNDKNGRINTAYKQYQEVNGRLDPEPGDSKYNKIFEKLIYDSNPGALDDTIRSIKEKTQQEPGVVLPDGRVIDGNRRLTALRMFQAEDHIPKDFEAVIIKLDVDSENDEKRIKELELDLQLGREERLPYDPIDRIYDVYNTIEVQKMMTVEEYKKASGAGNTKGINRDIRLANLILRFIDIVSPGGNPADKFYLARELKLDGPIEDIEGTINKLKSSDKESITDAVLAYLAVVKTKEGNVDATRIMRDVKENILNNDDTIQYFLAAVDDKVDDVYDVFENNPIKNGNDLKQTIQSAPELDKSVQELCSSVNRLIYKGKKSAERREALTELQDIRESLQEINCDDFKELTQDELLDAKEALKDIRDIVYKLNEGVMK